MYVNNKGAYVSKRLYEYDSRKIEKGDTFICLPNGEPYIKEAQRRGAEVVLEMSRKEMGVLANRYFNFPSKKLCVIGITGTNGKTTVASLVAQLLEKVGYKPAVLGTLSSALTTPESLDTQEFMADHYLNGGTHVVMEVSSHGIDQNRVDEIDFDYKLLTNISQDHLDYHGTFENYRSVKMRFMSDFPGAPIYPEEYQATEIAFKSPLLGQFNYDNMKAAVTLLQKLGIDDDSINSGLSVAKAPPGRFELIDEGQDFLTIVDYAHTPDGVSNVLKTAREIANAQCGRVLTLFGCGGDRDRLKRPLMREAVVAYSDYYIITQDNPRTEDESQIVQDIIQGLDKDSEQYDIINDRREAISSLIEKARKGDVVMIVGKGHETYQILKSGTIDFDDRKEARSVLRRMNNSLLD
ncbi:hypothetical protein DID77_01360 [Candidatus Marinamargulisbacteria bacterium SCGC AG-439-L15]|nr:hypothetical protein DID77_01360 [Candidatus Marinamargulisbacteria bacterium SCGC AG-439-L15]